MSICFHNVVSPFNPLTTTYVLPPTGYQVRELLEKGLSPNARSEFNRTRAIHVAVRRGVPEIVELLVNAGCNLDVLDDEGKPVYSLYTRASPKSYHQSE